LPIQYHPKRGTIVYANFDQGFKEPEMVKKRLCVVVSPPIDQRVRLLTVVPLSTTVPDPEMPYHYRLDIPFQLPKGWRNNSLWVKADMICAIGFHRVDLLRLDKNRAGKRVYQTNTLSKAHMQAISNCILSGIGLSSLTK